MPGLPSVLSELIPGYTLVELLGRGASGEVWKARAPGGLFKAIKIIHGNLEKDADEAVAAAQALKSLNRIRAVRHPFLLSLERVEVFDGKLIIVMELAERNLWDRFEGCTAQGLPGIPRGELLRYVEETAEVLDYMAVKYQLQHLAIQPRNLFLVRNHVKVADFGLVKDLSGTREAFSGSVSPVYAAPETFDGWANSSSDQYSLAMLYQEMLTGQRPFPGTNSGQLVRQHRRAEPDLSALPSGDKEIVSRALAKKPSLRFATCTDFALALRTGVVSPIVDSSSTAPSDRPTTHQAEVPATSLRKSRATPAIETPRPTALLNRQSVITKQADDAEEESCLAVPRHGMSRREVPPQQPESLPLPTPEDSDPPPEDSPVDEADHVEQTPRCPSCGAPLMRVRTDIEWCVKCGYSSSFQDSSPDPLENEQPHSTWSLGGLVDFCRLLARLPIWSWVLVTGIVGAMLVSVASDWMLPEDSLKRTYWSTLQLTVGVVAVLAAQLWAVMLVTPSNERLGLTQLLGLSVSLWGRTVRLLPVTRWPVWLASWGATLAIGAVFFVGGLTAWLERLPQQPIPEENAGFQAPERHDQRKRQLDQASATALMTNLEKKRNEGKVEPIVLPSEEAKPPDNRPTVDCLVIGYVPGEEEGSLKGLILATLREGKLVAAGMVEKGFTSEERKDLLNRFTPLKRDEPLLDGVEVEKEKGKPVWLAPLLRCEIHQSGENEAGSLLEPSFKSLLK